jgi:hypothetical protein
LVVKASDNDAFVVDAGQIGGLRAGHLVSLDLPSLSRMKPRNPAWPVGKYVPTIVSEWLIPLPVPPSRLGIKVNLQVSVWAKRA